MLALLGLTLTGSQVKGMSFLVTRPRGLCVDLLLVSTFFKKLL